MPGSRENIPVQSVQRSSADKEERSMAMLRTGLSISFAMRKMTG